MEYNKALHLAQQVLDSEFEEVNRKPADYCRAMGWHKDSPGTQKAIKKQGELTPTADDYEALAQIFVSIETDDVMDALESNSVSDFKCNCVAKHIQS